MSEQDFMPVALAIAALVLTWAALVRRARVTRSSATRRENALHALAHVVDRVNSTRLE